MVSVDDLLLFLLGFAENPLLYSLAFFLFAVAATVALPIPVEIGLLNPFLPFWLLVLVLAAGKGVGAAIVYPVGGLAGDRIRGWTRLWPPLGRLYAWIEGVVARYGYAALFALLSIPFMTDTVPVYAFAILNPVAPGGAISTGREHAPPPRGATGVRRFGPGRFVLVNALAGGARGLLFLGLPLLLGWP